MGVQVEKVGVDIQPQIMTKSRVLVPAKAPAVVGGPGVSYTVPQGTLFIGLSNDYYGLGNSFAIASPYSNWTFTNKTATIPSFVWTIPAYIGTIDTTATSENFNVKVTTGSYTMPSLKGSANGLDSTFIFGKNFNKKAANSYIDASGSSYTAPATDTAPSRTYNLSNWLIDFGQVTWTFATGDYAFGTGTSEIDALVSYYEKPQSTLYFEGANFFLGALSAPAGTTFTLRVITVDIDANGKFALKDTVATSYCTIEEAVVAAATAQVLPFSKLVAIDNDGFETEVPYLELDEPFFLELSGFNTAGITLGARSSRYDGGDTKLPYTNNHAFIYAPNANGVRALQSYSFSATLEATLTNAAYAYLLSDTKSVVADINGGTANIVLTPMFNGAWVEGELPSWIVSAETEHYESGNWGTDYKLTYEALPVGVAGRSADIIFKTWGAKTMVHVSQGTITGISSVKDTKSKVYTTASTFELTYPNEFNKATLLSLSGQVIASYDLPTSGKFSIPTSGISKGIYFVKMVGSGTETVKVIR